MHPKTKKKAIKLPEGAGDIFPNPGGKDKEDLDVDAIHVVEDLLRREWRAHSCRPKPEVTGYYVIFRWFKRDKAWAPLFIGHGNVGSSLTRHFSGKDKTPIGKYLSSFPHDQRKLIWIKWCKDLSHHTHEPTCVEEISRVVAAKYNNGEQPPFNFPPEEVLPENFSILSGR